MWGERAAVGEWGQQVWRQAKRGEEIGEVGGGEYYVTLQSRKHIGNYSLP